MRLLMLLLLRRHVALWIDGRRSVGRIQIWSRLVSLRGRRWLLMLRRHVSVGSCRLLLGLRLLHLCDCGRNLGELCLRIHVVAGLLGMLLGMLLRWLLGMLWQLLLLWVGHGRGLGIIDGLGHGGSGRGLSQMGWQS